MSYAELRAKFFPPTRPIVKADPSLWQPKPPPDRNPMVRRLIPMEPLCVPPPRSRIEAIAKLTCTMFGISKATLVGDSHDQLAVKARTYAAWRLHHELGLGKSHVGRILNRDHSSIFNILEKAAGRVGKIQRRKSRAAICG